MAGPQSAQFCLRSRGSELFIQRTRITLIIENMKDAQNLNRQFLQTYDLLAVQPMGDEKVFQYCCQSIQPDIIALDLSKKIPFHLKFSTVGSAISNGCFFEISIRGTTDNPTARKNFFRNSLSLIRACKKKNIILTSGAATPFDMRSPHDIQNVALLLGISAPEALAAMSIHALSVLLHAGKVTHEVIKVGFIVFNIGIFIISIESRSIHKTVIQARSIESLSEHDSWKKPSSSIN